MHSESSRSVQMASNDPSHRTRKLCKNHVQATSSSATNVCREAYSFKSHDSEEIPEKYLKKTKKRAGNRRRKPRKRRDPGTHDVFTEIDPNTVEAGTTKSRKKDGNLETMILSLRMSGKKQEPPTPGYSPIRPERLSFSGTANTPSFYSP